MESVELQNIPVEHLEQYKIVRDGKIWSCYSKKFLKTRICNGYHYFTRTIKRQKNGKCKTKNFAIHRLLAITFISNPDNLPIVDHIDGNSTNNQLENLRWVTQKQNINSITLPTSHPREVIQLKDGQVIQKFETVTEAAKHIGLSRSAISKACLGINKTAGDYMWSYSNSTHNHSDVNLTGVPNIYNFPNYFVFEDGRIYNYKRKSYLKPVKNKAGYTYVTLSNGKTKRNHYIHLIVADHHLAKERGTLQVNHKNKIRHDNRVQNLELLSCSLNMKHAHTKTLDTKPNEKSFGGLS